MTNRLIFAHPDSQSLAQGLAAVLNAPMGEAVFDHFPDGESYVRIDSDVRSSEVIVVATLNNPDPKILPLIYFLYTAKELGADNVTLVAPYLAYMRQDKRFQQGESLSSLYFGRLLSTYFDRLITVEPHLHSDRTMHDIFFCPAQALEAAPLIRDWLLKNVKAPLLVGPDEASLGMINAVNRHFNAPTAVFTKKRLSGASVNVAYQDLRAWQSHTPVLIDDMIATGGTMLETLKHLAHQNMQHAICIGVHGIFVSNAYHKLKQSNVQQIITSNSIEHETNALDVTPLIASGLH